MHKHTIDWYLQVSITTDAVLAQKRWDTAVALAKTLPRGRLIELLRLFLFAPSGSDFNNQFTQEIIELDPEFPVSKNIQELRMMAGLVMITTFEHPSDYADGFALGLRSANFPAGRVKPIQPAVLTEAENYLRSEAARIRPEAFATNVGEGVKKKLLGSGKTWSEASASGDESKKTAAFTSYSESIATAITNGDRELAARIEQLAEESALLWWVLVEYSDALERPVNELFPESYALPAAVEAAERTTLLPPPPSVGPLINRALKACRSNEKKLVLSDYIKATDPVWRASQVKSLNVADCRDLSPLSAVLEKTEELGSAATAMKALVKLCPGIKGDLPLTPSQAAQQFYNEILFLRTLKTPAT